MGQFYYAAKAFDVLERLDPNPEYWEGKRGACVGVFQLIIAGHEPRFVFSSSLTIYSKQSQNSVVPETKEAYNMSTPVRLLEFYCLQVPVHTKLSIGQIF